MEILRDLVLKSDDLPRRPVPTPEWPQADGRVFARALSGDERDKWEVFMANHSEPVEDGDVRRLRPGTKHIRATLIVMGACDENGDAIFSENDVIAIGMKNAAPLDRLYDAIRELSGMTLEAAAVPLPLGSDSSAGSASESEE